MEESVNANVRGFFVKQLRVNKIGGFSGATPLPVSSSPRTTPIPLKQLSSYLYLFIFMIMRLRLVHSYPESFTVFTVGHFFPTICLALVKNFVLFLPLKAPVRCKNSAFGR
jgi:hypothetical protein